MNISHSEMVARLMKPKADLQFTPEQADMIHAILGISGECGELLDAIKKHVIYGKPLDRENLVEELGDLAFYVQHLETICGITHEEAIAANMAKLAKRYPGYEYTDAKAKERADKSDDGWIEWKGGACPVASGVLVDYTCCDGFTMESYPAQLLSWSHVQNGSDIVAYRLSK